MDTHLGVEVSGLWAARCRRTTAVGRTSPADPGIGAPEIPALAERRVSFVRNTDILLREVHGGPAWVANLSYAGVAVVVMTWLGLIAAAGRHISLSLGFETISSPVPANRRGASPWQ